MPAKAITSVMSGVSRIAIDRRHFISGLTVVAAAGSTTLTVLGAPVSYKIGPMPQLPLPPLRRTEYQSRYLSADGNIVLGGGYCWELWLSQWVNAGFARRIPFWINVDTDRQKLWLLGRATFAPKLTTEIMKAHRKDPWPDMNTTVIHRWTGKMSNEKVRKNGCV